MNTFCALVLSTIMVIASVLLPSPTQAEQKMDSVMVEDMRGMRYCEFLLIYEDRVEVFNTTGSAGGCPAKIWDTLDTDELAKAHGARKVQLNGPKFWAADEQVLGLGASKDFNGIKARYAAKLPLAAISEGEGSDPYVPFTTKKEQKLVYKKGQPVYELVDRDGGVFVLNAYGAKVKDGDPAHLADQLSPAEGWNFRVRVLDQDLVKIHKGDTPSKMVGDDFHQYYSLETNE